MNIKKIMGSKKDVEQRIEPLGIRENEKENNNNLCSFHQLSKTSPVESFKAKNCTNINPKVLK